MDNQKNNNFSVFYSISSLKKNKNNKKENNNIITKEIILEILDKPKNENCKIHEKSSIGIINGGLIGFDQTPSVIKIRKIQS